MDSGWVDRRCGVFASVFMGRAIICHSAPFGLSRAGEELNESKGVHGSSGSPDIGACLAAAALGGAWAVA